MIDFFVINALIGGFGIAILAGALGCFVIWRNMSYFGDALSHSAMLGVSIGLLLNINLFLAVIGIAIIFALLLSYGNFRYSNDTVLGILSYSFLSLAIILASYNHIKLDLMSYLFGDILIINNNDLLFLGICFITIISWLYFNWSNLVLLSISEDLLHAEGVNTKFLKIKFVLILSGFIAISFKIVGVLLITAMLIIPSASAFVFSRTPLQMIINGAIIGCLSILGGMYSAIQYDLPTGPAIIIVSVLLLLCSNIIKLAKNYK